MRILLLNEYYPPDTSATAKIAALVAEHLGRHHEVTVVAGRPCYDPTEYYPFRFLRRDVQNGVVVERVGSTAYPRHKMKRRIANYLSYLTLAVPRAISLRPDLIIAMTDPPIAGIAGALVSRITGRPFVYNIRDLYPDMALGGDIVRPRAWVRRWENMHRRALRRAQRVVVLGDDMRDRILAKGVAPDRVAVVRDGTASSASLPDPCDPIVQELRCGFPFVVVHAGNLGFYGAWNTLIEAARLLRNDSIGLVFVGDGANRAAIESSANGLPNVRFLPFRPPEEIPHVMMAGDIHIVTVRRSLAGVVVPSKLYSILAAGRPVLTIAAPECDASRIVTSAECGVVVDPDEPAAVAQAIRSLRDAPVRLATMASHARDVAQSYARVKELDRFAAIVEEAAGITP